MAIKRTTTRASPSQAPVQGAAGRRVAARPLQVMSFGCQGLDDVPPQALAITYWLDVAAEGEPHPVTIRFAGRRVGVKGKPGPGDSFNVVETIERVLPGSGPVAITKRIFDVSPGEWHVTATPVKDTRSRAATTRSGSTHLPRLPSASSTGATGYGPILRILAPGTCLGAWPALVSVGVAVALITQALLAAHANLAVSRVLLVSVVASVFGLACARLYYWAGHRGERGSLFPGGTCIQGFLLGATAALVVGAPVNDLPVGRLLDVSAPGLLFAMTIGRFGCLFGGCCVGRPTGSRWGLWSSDRRLGVRRYPTQLFESALALMVGLVALLVVWTTAPYPAGVVFIAAIAAYTFGRQLLFPLRDFSHTARGRTLTMALAGLVIVVDVAIAVLA